MTKKRARTVPKDIALVHGPTEDGAGARVLRFKDGEVYAGEVRPVREGQPIADQELVRLKPMAGRAPLCEVEVVHEGKPAPAAEKGKSTGPAQVATDTYRRNWNTVFGASNRNGTNGKKPKEYSVN